MKDPQHPGSLMQWFSECGFLDQEHQVSPGKLSEMQILRPHPGPTEFKTPEGRAQKSVLSTLQLI